MGFNAAQLPYEILVECFEAARCQDLVHGGELVRWASNEAVAPFALVCKAWANPAQQVLHRSVSIFNEHEAALFIRTMRARPDLAGKVRNLVLTLDEEEEARAGESANELEARHIAETEQLTQVLEACPAVEHLQARTVHPRGGWRFLKAITDKRSIKTFIGGPRPCNPLHSWKSVHFDKPFPLVFEHMSTFELDTPYGGASRPSPVLVFPVLEKCRMSCEIPNDTLFDFFQGVGTTLREMYIYQERLIPIDRLAASLSHQFNTLRELKFQLNPSITELDTHFRSSVTPLFDELFQMKPTYQNLVNLTASSTEISVRALRHLPPSLKYLEVASFSDYSHFDPDELLETVRDPEVDLRQLRTLTVRDVQVQWRGLEAALETVCHNRGIEFVFVPNDEVHAENMSGASGLSEHSTVWTSDEDGNDF